MMLHCYEESYLHHRKIDFIEINLSKTRICFYLYEYSYVIEQLDNPHRILHRYEDPYVPDKKRNERNME